jgi:hypothetical protein
LARSAAPRLDAFSRYYLVAGGAGKAEFQFREQNGISAFYWVEDGLAYAIAANAPPESAAQSRGDRLPAELS